MEFFLISLLNGVSYGLLLFMMAAGLTLIFSMMGVLNFAHASFYMLGAYFAYTLVAALELVPGLSGAAFWIALFLAPVLVGLLGAVVERYGLRRVHRWGHVHELLFTFGLSFVILELVQLAWGKVAVPYRVPPELGGTLFTLFSTNFPAYRGFMMLVSIAMLVALWLVLTRTRIGLVIQAALTHPDMTQALGHNVPRVFMLVFGGGCLLAGLAGVIGGNAFITDPSMAMAVGPIIFVVTVVGGMGSLVGAFIASLLIGIIQVMATGVDASLVSVFSRLGWQVTSETPLYSLWSIGISQVAPILPYLLLVLVLIFRPKGLMGTRET